MQPAPGPFPAPDRLLEHDAFVRSLARHLIGNPAGAEDLVQETYAAALAHPQRRPGPVRAWLAAIVRHLAWKQRRTDERRARRESTAAPPDPVPSAAEVRASEEQRRRLVERVLALDEPARSTMLLRYFRQLPPRAIAKHFGVPVETVRTRIKRALERLRLDLDREHGGDRGAWLAALLPFAMSPPAGPVAAAAAATSAGLAAIGAGAVAMSMKAKLATAVVVLSGVLATAVMWRGNLGESDASAAAHGTPTTSDRPTPAASDAPKLDPAQSHAERVAEPRAPTAEPTPPPAAIETGSILVRMQSHGGEYAGDDVTVALVTDPGAPPAHAPERRVSRNGTCRFDAVAPGVVSLVADRGGYAQAEVVAG